MNIDHPKFSTRNRLEAEIRYLDTNPSNPFADWLRERHGISRPDSVTGRPASERSDFVNSNG